jgi:hypothetical protein
MADLASSAGRLQQLTKDLRRVEASPPVAMNNATTKAAPM